MLTTEEKKLLTQETLDYIKSVQKKAELQPGDITISMYIEITNVSHSTAVRKLNEEAKAGKLEKLKGVVNGRETSIYRPIRNEN